MLLILNDPTPSELEMLQRIIGDVKFDIVDRKMNYLTTVEKTIKEHDWLSASTFVKLLAEKGYSCKSPITRLRLCKMFGVQYQKKGNEIWFKNE